MIKKLVRTIMELIERDRAFLGYEIKDITPFKNPENCFASLPWCWKVMDGGSSIRMLGRSFDHNNFAGVIAKLDKEIPQAVIDESKEFGWKEEITPFSLEESRSFVCPRPTELRPDAWRSILSSSSLAYIEKGVERAEEFPGQLARYKNLTKLMVVGVGSFIVLAIVLGLQLG